jgi:hypothetical protein
MAAATGNTEYQDIYTHPQYITELFRNMMDDLLSRQHYRDFNAFSNYLNTLNHYPYRNDNAVFHYKQYWVRFLICTGRYNDVVQFIRNIIPPTEIYITQRERDEYVRNFINYNHPSFNNLSIKQMAFLWSSNRIFINHLINLSTEFENEEYIQNLINNHVEWTNPFVNVFGGLRKFTNYNGDPYTRRIEFHFNMFE